MSFGLKISRVAKDLYELLTELDLNEVALLGYSMGSSVIWCYIDLFGPERLSKIILVDQSPFLTSDPNWTQQELEDSGAIFTAQQVFDTVAASRSKEAEQVIRQVIDRMVTQHATPEMKEWIVQCNLKMPRDLAGTLMYNHWHMDWRDLIPRINLPTLIISGRASVMRLSLTQLIVSLLNTLVSLSDVSLRAGFDRPAGSSAALAEAIGGPIGTARGSLHF